MSDPLTHVRRKLAIVTKDKDVLNFFDDEKLIIISRGSDKISKIIEEII